MNEFSIRFASEDDYEAVLKISEGVYNGHDYLPFVYHQWLKDTHHLVFLGISEENIVGLLVANTADDSKTVIHKARRVKKTFRGKGFGTMLALKVNEYVRNNYSSVVRIRSAVTIGWRDGSDQAKCALQRKEGKRVILEKRIISFYIDKGTGLIENLKTIVPSCHLSPCSKSQISRLVFSESSGSLFERSIHISDGAPYDLLPSNTEQMFPNNARYFVSYSTIAEDVDTKSTTMSAFSQSCMNLRVLFPQWRVNIWTTDPVLLRDHLLYQLKTALTAMEEEFLLVVTLNTGMAEHGLRFLNEELQMDPYVEFAEGVQFYEKELL